MTKHSQRYLSDELIHLVGRKCKEDGERQYEILKKILAEEWLTHPPHNINQLGNLTINSHARISQNEMYSPQVVCFCDIPIPDLPLHISKYGSFGLSFDKNFIIEKGGSPVLYIPKQSKVRSELRKDVPLEERYEIYKREGPNAIYDHIDKAKLFDQMIQKYHKFINSISPDPETEDFEQLKLKYEIAQFLDFQIFSHIMFYDSVLSDDDPDNYYFEREWRMNGHLKFNIKNIKTIFITKKYSARFRGDFPHYLGQLVFVDLL